MESLPETNNNDVAVYVNNGNDKRYPRTSGMTSANRLASRIKCGQIVAKLQKYVLCADGSVVMSSGQLTAAKLLLDRVLPQLKAIEVDVTDNTTQQDYSHMNTRDLIAIAERISITNQQLTPEPLPVPAQTTPATDFEMGDE